VAVSWITPASEDYPTVGAEARHKRDEGRSRNGKGRDDDDEDDELPRNDDSAKLRAHSAQC
jgi:hypothetical protein